MTDSTQVTDESDRIETPYPVQDPPLPPALDVSPSLADLAKSVRRHKIWLIVLTVAVLVPVIVSCGSIALVTSTFGLGSGMPAIEAEEIDATRSEIEDALGGKIEDLDVRAVSMSYGDTGFPYSFIDGGFDEESIYVEFRLKGSGVVVADVIGGPFGMDAASSGLIPTRGSLASRMTDEQYDRLVAAYADETSAPLGAIRRYTDASFMMMEETSVPDEVVVGDTTYPSKELWSATEGKLISGDSVDMDVEMGASRSAFIFHEDPKTGEFTPLGTETADIWW